MFPLGHIFREGHRVRIQIHTPPTFDGLWGYTPRHEPAAVTVHQGAYRPSRMPPVVEPDGTTTYTAVPKGDRVAAGYADDHRVVVIGRNCVGATARRTDRRLDFDNVRFPRQCPHFDTSPLATDADERLRVTVAPLAAPGQSVVNESQLSVTPTEQIGDLGIHLIERMERVDQTMLTDYFDGVATIPLSSRTHRWDAVWIPSSDMHAGRPGGGLRRPVTRADTHSTGYPRRRAGSVLGAFTGAVEAMLDEEWSCSPAVPVDRSGASIDAQLYSGS